MWDPLKRVDDDDRWAKTPESIAVARAAGVPEDDEVWWSDRFQVRVRFVPRSDGSSGTRDGLVHLSINSHNRAPVRRWRHLQQIKNEIMGEDRWAVEVFPAEDDLADTSNQYHLWVMPAGETPGFGFRGRLVSTPEDVERFNAEREAGLHKGRQEPWEPGLTTGQRESDTSMYEGGASLTQPERRPPAGQSPILPGDE